MSDAIRPRIVFLTLSDDVGSERIVSEMGRQGATCAVLGRPGSLAGLCQGVHLDHLPSRGGAWAAAMAVPRRLETLMSRWCPDAVVPLDDLASHVLRDMALARRTSAGLRTLLHKSLGDPNHYGTVCSRGQLIELAAGLGIRTPGQRPLTGLRSAVAAAADLGYPVLLKREQTCGGGGVTLVETAPALSRAFRSADRRARAKRLARRIVRLAASHDRPLTLQAFVDGKLALRSVACREGRVLDGITFSADQLDPPVTGSSTVIRPIDHPEIEDAVLRLTGALGCSGFLSFDFLVSPDGSASLIELNARPVGSGHLGSACGHDIYRAWLEQFPGFHVAKAVTPALDSAHPIALFPKEMQRDPASARLSPGAAHHHDVPWDEPRVLAAYRDRLARRHPQKADLIARRLSLMSEAGDAPTRSGTAPFDIEVPAGLWSWL